MAFSVSRLFALALLFPLAFPAEALSDPGKPPASAIAAPAAPPARLLLHGSSLSAKGLERFRLASSRISDSIAEFEFFPLGERQDSWTRKILIQSIRGKQTGDPDVVLQVAAASLRSLCREELLSSQVASGASAGGEFSLAALSCPDDARGGMIAASVAAQQGAGSMIVLQSWRRAPLPKKPAPGQPPAPSAPASALSAASLLELTLSDIEALDPGIAIDPAPGPSQ